jgi:hypothetical protein
LIANQVVPHMSTTTVNMSGVGTLGR